MKSKDKSCNKGVSLSRVSVVAGGALALVVIAVAVMSAPTLMRVNSMTALQSINAPRAIEQQRLALAAEQMSKYGQEAIQSSDEAVRTEAVAKFNENAEMLMQSDVLEDKSMVEAAVSALRLAYDATDAAHALRAQETKIVRRAPQLVDDIALILSPAMDELSADMNALQTAQRMLLALRDAQSGVEATPHVTNPKRMKKQIRKFRGGVSRVMREREALNKSVESYAGLDELIEELKTMNSIFDLHVQIIEKLNEVNATTEDATLKVSQIVQNLVQGATAASDSIIEDTHLIEKETAFLMVVLGIGGAVVLGSLVVFGILSQIQILLPLQSYSSLLRDLVEGKHSKQEVKSSCLTEFQDIGKAAASLRKAIAQQAEAQRREEELANQAREERHRTLNELADRFQQSIGSVADSISQATALIETSTNSMLTISEGTSSHVESVTSAADTANSGMESMSSQTSELSQSINEISSRMASSATISDSAVMQASDATSRIRELSDAVKKIGEILSFITDIADQTNLLALNATIEAARAGDAGKGFAVVASEVKNLANQTTKATEEIRIQIENIQVATGTTTDAVVTISDTISKLSEIGSAVAAAVEEQDAATRSIASNVGDASERTQDVARGIAEVNDGTQRTRSALDEVKYASDILVAQVRVLSQSADAFLREIRPQPAE